jgi:PPOX class probable F420-dependent enzyme, Rv2061 family
MAETGIKQFEKQKYLNLETYRKSGEAMRTPVWFVEEGGNLYVRTGAESGKVKRIKRNSEVMVAPCAMNGKVQGTWVKAVAEIMDGPEVAHLEALLDRKYGLQKKLFEALGGVDSTGKAAIKLRLLE